MADETESEFVGVDISAAIDTARERLGGIEGTSFVQADILALPFAPASFDLVFSEGVLHHTPSTESGASRRSARLLRPGGEIMIYVYRRKAPAREYVDDYVRERIADLPPEEAWDLLRPLTRLGQALAELETRSRCRRTSSCSASRRACTTSSGSSTGTSRSSSGIRR